VVGGRGGVLVHPRARTDSILRVVKLIKDLTDANGRLVYPDSCHLIAIRS